MDFKKIIVLDQLRLIKLRNTSSAFNGELIISDTEKHKIHLTWKKKKSRAKLNAELKTLNFIIKHSDSSGDEKIMCFE